MLTHCLVSNWPRGETQLRLTVKHAKNDEAVELPTIAPRTLGLHPTQLYEVVSMVLLFLVLTAYYPLRRRPGQVMAVLMVGYGIHRSLNELLRDDPRPQGFEQLHQSRSDRGGDRSVGVSPDTASADGDEGGV